MDLAQARAVMDAQFGPNPPRFGDWQVAGRVIAQHYEQHPEALMPTSFDTLTAGRTQGVTTDSTKRPARGPSGMRDRPGRTQDQPAYQPVEKSREWLREEARGARLDESWANI